MSAGDYYDRFGKPMPQDWYDRKKYPKQSEWTTERRVGNTTIGDVTVSTVWLGLDHSYGEGPPLIFETMAFGGEWDQTMDRYSTEEEAMRGHLEVLDRLREGRPPFARFDNEDEA